MSPRFERWSVSVDGQQVQRARPVLAAMASMVRWCVELVGKLERASQSPLSGSLVPVSGNASVEVDGDGIEQEPPGRDTSGRCEGSRCEGSR